MPYRIDITRPPDEALDLLIQFGALDIEEVDGRLAAIIPDSVTAEALAAALGLEGVTVSPAVARDNGSVWLLKPRAVRIGGHVIRLTDSAIFGTGHHPTTALCIEAIEDALTVSTPESILDIGTGSGVLALAALVKGVPRATGIDIDPDALKIAAEHARMNDLAQRLQLVHGGPNAIEGTWPLVVANVLAGPLIEMAPAVVPRVGSRGRLILSGISESLESEVARAYQHLGMRHIRSDARAGWTVVVFQASW